LHRITTMNNYTDYEDKYNTENVWHDKTIPLKICNHHQDDWSIGINNYCPDF